MRERNEFLPEFEHRRRRQQYSGPHGDYVQLRRFPHRLKRFPIRPLFAFALGWGFFASADDDTNLKYFRDHTETRNFTLGKPVSPKLTPDGSAVIFLRSGPGDPVLERELITPAQILGGAE